MNTLAPTVVALAVVVAAIPLRPRPRRRGADAAPPSRPHLDERVAAWTQRRASRRDPAPRAVADWCDDVARRVRSGSSLRDAVIQMPTDTATAAATTPLRLAIDRGQSVAEAVHRVDDAGPHLRLALAVIATASRIGGPSAASIDRTAVVLRQRAADLDERSSHAAQARLSTHVMTAVPLVMLAVLVVTDDDVRSVATSPIGTACIAIGLVMNATGWWWMHRIVRPTS